METIASYWNDLASSQISLLLVNFINGWDCLGMIAIISCVVTVLHANRVVNCITWLPKHIDWKRSGNWLITYFTLNTVLLPSSKASCGWYIILKVNQGITNFGLNKRKVIWLDILDHVHNALWVKVKLDHGLVVNYRRTEIEQNWCVISRHCDSTFVCILAHQMVETIGGYCLDFNEEFHWVKVSKWMLWPTGQSMWRWNSVNKSSTGGIGKECIIFSERWSNKLLLKLFRLHKDNVRLRIIRQPNTLNEDVGSSAKWCNTDPVSTLRLEIGTLGLLECLFSISDTFEVTSGSLRIRRTNEINGITCNQIKQDA
jgi:hypothetical protein